MIEESARVDFVTDSAWGVYQIKFETETHIIPEGDVCTHIRGVNCWCGPRVEEGNLIIHTSGDLREYFENQECEC